MFYSAEARNNQVPLHALSPFIEGEKSKLDHALAMARYGRIFLLKPNSEEPLIADWQRLAEGIADLDRCADWIVQATRGRRRPEAIVASPLLPNQGSER